MTKVELIIDNRERKVLKLIECRHITESLDVADFIFKSEGENILLIERKTLCDLSSSIKDGRYRNQKQRMMTEVKKPSQIIYLIEFEGIFGLTDAAYFSAITNTICRDGMSVICTRNVEETSLMIESFYKSISKFGYYWCENNFDEEKYQKRYSTVKNVVKKKKSDNNTNKISYKNYLGTLPGISEVRSENILKVYPTLKKFLKAADKKKEKMFDPVTGIGKVTAKKVIKFLQED